MKFPRSFVVALLVAAMPRPAAASSDPAVSVQALFSKDDCEAIPGLLGDWIPQAGNDLSGNWTIQKLGDGRYRLIERDAHSDTGRKLAFDICAAHLDGHLFFDVTAQVVGPDGKNVIEVDDDLFWIPVHLIGRLEIEKSALSFRLLDNYWLHDALNSGRVSLTTAPEDSGDYLVTAPTKELRLFVARIADEAEAFSSEENFDRVPSEGEIPGH